MLLCECLCVPLWFHARASNQDTTRKNARCAAAARWWEFDRGETAGGVMQWLDFKTEVMLREPWRPKNPAASTGDDQTPLAILCTSPLALHRAEASKRMTRLARFEACHMPGARLKICHSCQLQRGVVSAYQFAPPHANGGGCQRGPLRFSARVAAVVGAHILKTTRE